MSVLSYTRSTLSDPTNAASVSINSNFTSHRTTNASTIPRTVMLSTVAPLSSFVTHQHCGIVAKNFNEIRLRIKKNNPTRYIVVPTVTIPLVLTANMAIILGVDSVSAEPPVLGILLPVEVPGLKSDPDPSIPLSL